MRMEQRRINEGHHRYLSHLAQQQQQPPPPPLDLAPIVPRQWEDPWAPYQQAAGVAAQAAQAAAQDVEGSGTESGEDDSAEDVPPATATAPRSSTQIPLHEKGKGVARPEDEEESDEEDDDDDDADE